MNTISVYRPVSIQSALDDFDRLLGSFFGESPLTPAANALGLRRPAVDVIEFDGSYRLEAELPGFDEKSVVVHLEGRVLTIESKQEEGQDKKEGTYVLRERRNAEFKRSFTLPEDADAESVSAAFTNGILSLEIKKRPEAKRRIVKIEGK